MSQPVIQRRFLVLLKVGVATTDRLAEIVPGLKRVIDRVSRNENEILFRAVQADVFGYLLKSGLNAAQIRAAIESPSRGLQVTRPEDEPFLTNKDSVVVVELGADADAAVGFSRALTWLQRH